MSDNKEPLTVNKMIDILQSLKKEYGNFKLLHSFNTIHSIQISEFNGETFVELKGISHDS